jgi:hypothetical protein
MTEAGQSVFTHAMWRTSSTYFFRLFREHDAYRVYYEPFHEKLANLREAFGVPFEPSHPALSKPYFDEYRGVGKNGVLPYFDARFSYLQRLWAEFDQQCLAYVRYLEGKAREAGKIPVFQFNRSYLCLPHFQHYHPTARQFYLVRNPRYQFISCNRSGRAYYLGLSFLQFACQARGASREAFRRVAIPFYYSRQKLENTLIFYSTYAKLGDQTCYYALFMLWCQGLLDALDLGMPRVCVDLEYDRDGVEGVLDFLARRFPDLAARDYRPTSYPLSDEATQGFRAVESLALSHLKEAGVGAERMAALTAVLKTAGAECGDQPEDPSLFNRIADELRLATDSNVASLADGVRLATP